MKCRTSSARWSSVLSMSDTPARTEPWLFTHATRQRGRLPSAALPYDDERQITVVVDAGRRVPAVERYPPPQTKKGDIEKGEDQKDRW